MTQIKIIQGDITKISVDAIVNAANKTLLGGGGVDGAIHFVAGRELHDECKNLGGCNTGEAKITKGYALPAKYVIHTVGPAYGYENGDDAVLLANCYKNSLLLAQKHGLRSIAFPAISTGVFRYPKDEAAKIALTSVKDFIKENLDVFDEVYFISIDEFNHSIYENLWNQEY
ncbi:MAG: O-acetyl-ADP-ribose deacetylase [Candidatus Yanofskybacteria bacterium RIFCSPHIGHO2_01_FULL_39_8b]|uniref:O-acetyl-ADP-ribose deacetylase n=1 Tax=Candidatus Yanofskybacteria bacterium RIFCSPHIGHO2_01_FULL_39_8b TaxID=1802659 RepID=A0A1F8EAH4_9BACT|nr:MAG: O-acetyl-ADP-ribose deacetylase [Candidatus Yanofskybacteria bacterium RIFCSPHIGHO2_01_FULL_39_8b]